MWKLFTKLYCTHVLKKHHCKFSRGPTHLRRGAMLTLESHVKLGDVEVVSRSLKIGAHTYVRNGSELLDVDEIGRFCSIGKNVVIGIKGKQHPSDWLSTSLFEQKLFDRYMGTLDNPIVSIGHDCWIGRDAIIMAGVKIGNGAIIGTRALVTEDVPPYAVVVGAPARIIRYRFSDEMIARLQATRWWEFSKEFLSKLDFSNPEQCIEKIEATNSIPKANYTRLVLRKSGVEVNPSL